MTLSNLILGFNIMLSIVPMCSTMQCWWPSSCDSCYHTGQAHNASKTLRELDCSYSPAGIIRRRPWLLASNASFASCWHFKIQEGNSVSTATYIFATLANFLGNYNINISSNIEQLSAELVVITSYNMETHLLAGQQSVDIVN